MNGWSHGAELDRGDRWNPAEVGSAVVDLLGQSPEPLPVYGAQPV